MRVVEKFVERNALLSTREIVGVIDDNLCSNEVIATSFELKAKKVYANELRNSAIWLWTLAIGLGILTSMAVMIVMTPIITILSGIVIGVLALVFLALCCSLTVSAVKITQKTREAREDARVLAEKLERATRNQNSYGVICHR